MHRTMTTAFSLVLGVAGTSQGLAVGSDGSEAGVIEEILVTAQRRHQAISEVPLAIQALSDEQIEVRGFVETSDIIKWVPGASSSQSLSPTATTVSIRGIGANSGSEPTVAYYLDETPFSIPGQAFSPTSNLFDMDRVEVLRSPQGTLYGQSSMGGTIKLISRDPDLRSGFGGRIKLGAAAVHDGNAGYSSDIALNIPMIEDRLAGRLVVSYQEPGSYVDSTDYPDANGSDDINDSELLNIRTKLLYQATDDLSIKLSYRYHSSDVYWGNVSSAHREREFNISGGQATYMDTQYHVGALTFDYNLGFATLTSTTNYIDWEHPIHFGYSFVVSDGGYTSDGLSHETRLVSSSDGPFQWVAGGYYRDASRNLTFVITIPGLGTLPEDDTTVDSEVWAVFGETSYELFDGFAEILLGLRYFEDKRDRKQIVGGVLQQAVDDKTTDINPRFNVTLRPTEDIMVFANIAKGYRSAMFNNNIAIAQAAMLGLGDLTATDSDSLWTYEVGVRWSFLDGDLSLELIGYYTDWKDAAYSVTVAPPIPADINIGDAELKGLDFALAWRTPLEGLTLSVSGNVNDSTWKNVNPLITRNNPNIVAGSDLASVPERTFYWTADYTRPVADNLEFFAFGSWAYRSDQLDINSLGSNIAPIDNIDDVSVRLGVRTHDNWEVSAYVNNLLDEDGTLSVVNGLAISILRPREYGLAVSYAF